MDWRDYNNQFVHPVPNLEVWTYQTQWHKKLLKNLEKANNLLRKDRRFSIKRETRNNDKKKNGGKKPNTKGKQGDDKKGSNRAPADCIQPLGTHTNGRIAWVTPC